MNLKIFFKHQLLLNVIEVAWCFHELLEREYLTVSKGVDNVTVYIYVI